MRRGTAPGWRVSSYSSGTSSTCVEIGQSSDLILIRDTQNRRGPSLDVPPAAWQAFAAALRR